MDERLERIELDETLDAGHEEAAYIQHLAYNAKTAADYSAIQVAALELAEQYREVAAKAHKLAHAAQESKR